MWIRGAVVGVELAAFIERLLFSQHFAVTGANTACSERENQGTERLSALAEVSHQKGGDPVPSEGLGNGTRFPVPDERALLSVLPATCGALEGMSQVQIRGPLRTPPLFPPSFP